MTDYQNIFNRDFFPTPSDVIEQMIGTDDIAGKIILEPSFGSGNIVNYLNAHGAQEVIGCEINDKLRRSVRGVRVIESDFMNVRAENVSHIDMIVMNPPFSQQEEHILHAWEIAPAGCEIISLCNASLIENRCYRTRQHVGDIIKMHGSSENIGNVFSDSSERRTDCEIALIKLYKPGEGKNEFDGYFTDEDDAPEAQGNGLIQYSFVREAVQRYVAAVSRVDAVLAASEEINNLTKEFDFLTIQFGAYSAANSGLGNITKDVFKKELQKRAWQWLFKKFDMDKYVTSSVMSTINKFVEKQSAVPFTMRNIYKMVEMIVGTHSDRMQQVILDAFDIICKFSADNVWHSEETWKTNSAHMINKKFIVPYICNYDSYYDYVSMSYSYHSDYAQKIDDIVKALCYITGKPYQWKERDERGNEKKVTLPTLREYVIETRMEYGKVYEWTFFRIKAFKKGTMHFEFIDEDVWAAFNQAVAKVRGWELPKNVKTKSRRRK